MELRKKIKNNLLFKHFGSYILYGNVFYRLSLYDPRFHLPIFTPVDLWNDETSINTELKIPNNGDFTKEALHFHSFTWLREYKHQHDKQTKQIIGRLANQWIQSFGHLWHPVAWSSATLAHRIFHWLLSFDFLRDSLEPDEVYSFEKSLFYQSRHLFRVKYNAANSYDCFLILRTLITLCFSYSHFQKRLLKTLRILEREITTHIFEDGGHSSRNPETHHKVFRHLIEIKSLFLTNQQDVPLFLQRALDRMAPMVRFFRHGDGGFSLFNGCNEGIATRVEYSLKTSKSKTPAPISAPHTGFERVQAKKTLALFDCGQAVNDYKSVLSFELSIGRTRVITNCGNYDGNDTSWKNALKSSPAHSTITLDDCSFITPFNLTCERNEQDGNTWINSHHDGYKDIYNVTVHRNLFLNSEGTELRGEDRLEGGQCNKYDIRFHLHPLIKVSALTNQNQALLRLPDGSGWKFMTSLPIVHIMESIYFGMRAKQKPTEQLVLTGKNHKKITIVKWALKKLD